MHPRSQTEHTECVLNPDRLIEDVSGFPRAET